MFVEGGSIVVKVMPTVLNMFFTVNPQTDACVYYATEFIAHLAANPYSRAGALNTWKFFCCSILC
jgi:hypothetical protein